MMKDLKEYIKEGLFDDLDKIEKIGGMESNVEMLKKEVIDWIIKNTKGQLHENKFKLDFNTTPITVDYSGSIEFKTNITSLTNGNFQWSKVSGDFRCFECELLESLEGGPKEVGWDFNCFKCKSLKSLEGAPEKVGDFGCSGCTSLTSLEGAPKEVRMDFICLSCGTKFTEEDVKKVSNVRGKINC